VVASDVLVVLPYTFPKKSGYNLSFMFPKIILKIMSESKNRYLGIKLLVRD